MNTWTSPGSLSDALIKRYGIDIADATGFKRSLQRIKLEALCFGLSIATGATGLALARVYGGPHLITGGSLVAMAVIFLLAVYIDTRVWKEVQA